MSEPAAPLAANALSHPHPFRTATNNMRKLLSLLCLAPVIVMADGLPSVTGLSLSTSLIQGQRWVQVAMHDADFNLYAFSCNIGYTNWCFVGGGDHNTSQPVPLYTAPFGLDLRDPSHIHYQGRYYLMYNDEDFGIGMAVSPDDVDWTYLGEAQVGYGQHWSPKFFIDGNNVLWCNVRYSDQVPGVYPWQQYCFRFNTNHPTDTSQDGRYLCTNIWARDNTDRPTAQIVWNDGLFYLINQTGDVFCSPTLLTNNWTQIGTNSFASTVDGPCIAKYQGVWYLTDSQNGSLHWYASLDLTNWSLSTMAGWTGFGLKEGTAIVEDYSISTVTLSWQPNYNAPGQATVVVAADTLALPLNQWQMVYQGTAGQCTLTNDRPMRYFSAYNVAAP